MVHAEIHIREATLRDGPELMALIRAAMADYARASGISTLLESQMETLDDIQAHILSDHVLVAEHRGRLAGTVRLVSNGGRTAYFSRFAVLPSLRRTGVGQMVYQAAEDWLRSKGFTTVWLHTAMTNKPLVDFYESRGFRLIEESAARGYPRGTFQKDFK
jgi:ribosomal protein S18 acetylase RimI-like enzyme